MDCNADEGTNQMKQYQNILVNALVNLGDVVLTTSAVALLRQAYPGAKITMLVKPVCREAVENNPVVDHVLAFGYQAKKKSLKDMLLMAERMHREGRSTSVVRMQLHVMYAFFKCLS